MKNLLTSSFMIAQLAIAQNQTDDIIARANRSAFMPRVSVQYSYRAEQPHWIWAAFAWDFDESFFTDKIAAAIEIKRLQRERQGLEVAISDLDIENAPSLD